MCTKVENYVLMKNVKYKLNKCVYTVFIDKV